MESLDCAVEPRLTSPKNAKELWTPEQYIALTHYLHNGNGRFAFTMGFRDEHGQPNFVASKTKSIQEILGWNQKTVWSASKKKVAFVPHSSNPDGESRWAALDFDAHDGDRRRALKLARKALSQVLLSEYALILEDSGRGYHLWILAEHALPVSSWARFLGQILQNLGSSIQPGKCEIFPPSGSERKPGKGMRAPGSWNPSSDTFSQILFYRGREWFEERLTEKNSSLFRGSEDQEEHRLNGEWLSLFRISQPSTRNNQLIAFTSFLFPQVGSATATRYIEDQWERRTAQTQANKTGHMDAFRRHWSAMVNTWEGSLNTAEISALKNLSTEIGRDAFKIIRGWEALRQTNGITADFPVSQQSLAERLGITRKGAGHWVDEFIRRGILKRVKDYVPKQKSARYVWLLKE